MAASRVLAFTDPHPFQTAIRAAEIEILPTTKGDFRGELTQIDLPRLWMQRGRESLARVFRSKVISRRAPIFFLTEANQPAMRHSGMEVSPGEIIVIGSGSAHHQRTAGPSQWGALSLTPEDLAAAGNALVGRDLAGPSVNHLIRPTPEAMSRLLKLHAAAGLLAKRAPERLAHPEVARALDQALVHAMVRCLTESIPVGKGATNRRHAAVIARFQELLEANHDQPLYLAEICAATGVSERTLRVCCHEHLGMGPVRYLWLRRMHLARRTLMCADAATATVTAIATDHGFWELGRFSVEYRALFGEQPSATLHRPPEVRRAFQNRPFSLPASEFA